MAGDLNRVTLIGRLTRDPELRQTNSGGAYCRFSIANNRSYTVNGEKREEVSYIDCVVWGRQAEILNQYCRKGKQVAIDGRLQQRSWDGQDGKKQSRIDVVVDSFQLLGSPGEGGQRAMAPAGGSREEYPAGEFSEPAFGGGMDDDIPF